MNVTHRCVYRLIAALYQTMNQADGRCLSVFAVKATFDDDEDDPEHQHHDNSNAIANAFVFTASFNTL